MADKTMPTRGQVSEATDVVNVVASYVHCFGDENTWSAPQIAGFIRRDLGRPDQKDALAEAIGTATHKLAQMGYDPVEAVRALPAIMRKLTEMREDAEESAFKYTDDVTECEACRDAMMDIDVLTARAAGKEGDDGQ